MISIGSLHGDILSLIFEFVDEMDLSNVVLVNNAFHDAGTPLLYRTLSFPKNVLIQDSKFVESIVV